MDNNTHKFHIESIANHFHYDIIKTMIAFCKVWQPLHILIHLTMRPIVCAVVCTKKFTFEFFSGKSENYT